MNKHRIGALLAAAALTLTFAGTALAVTYATVDHHEAMTDGSNSPEFWESEGVTCEKVYDDGGDAIDTWAADKDYVQVIVKAGADNVGDNANTVFKDVAEGELVYADTNGNNTPDPGGKDGDKNISHVIVCSAVETTTTTSDETTDTSTTTTTSTTSSAETTSSTTSKETTPEGSVEELTPPRTDVLGQPTSSSTVPTGVLLVLAGLLAAAMVVIPAAARRR